MTANNVSVVWPRQVQDPFAVREKSKVHPARAFYTLWARVAEMRARRNFASLALPIQSGPDSLPRSTDALDADTAVTVEQGAILRECAREVRALGQPIVEVGSYRGVTTVLLASETTSQVIAIDPFMGYGGSENDYKIFSGRTASVPNVRHLRKTSGGAAPEVETASLVFIDAVHDYANVRHDIHVWAPKVAPGGMIAFHDTDSADFAGTRRAVYEFLNSRSRFSLRYHVDNLTVLQRSIV